MAIAPERLLSHEFGDISQSYVERDAILYALGVGLGTDPTNDNDLQYLLEDRLKVLPTMAVTLASPGMWVREPSLGIDWVRLVHSAQAADFFAPLPPKADIVGSARVTSLHDRGARRGAVVVVERIIRDARDANLIYCALRQTLLLRGDGGFGGEAPPEDNSGEPPSRDPDFRIAIATSPRAALIYRLSGDWNPLHADPAVARLAGFERPILHGLASYGMAGLAICRAVGVDLAQLRSLALRFAHVVFPGDVLDFSIWRDDADVTFEARVSDKIVLSKGRASIGEAK